MTETFDEKRRDLQPYGLTCEVWQPNIMRRADRHNEIEINYLPEGSITYLIHDQKFKIEKGAIVVFWALLPHQIVDYTKNSPYYVITIPLGMLQHWQLAEPFLNHLLNGEIQFLTAPEDSELDNRLFKRWVQDITSANSATRDIGALEIRAYLERVALLLSGQAEFEGRTNLLPMSIVEKMAIYIAGNFTQPIKARDIAASVNLHPDYANTVFKKAFNLTISRYLSEQRILFSKRMLSVSTNSISSIAYESGFNSISRFNATFKKHTGVTPREYRLNNASISGHLRTSG